MKNFKLFTLAFIAVLTLTTTSCSSDDDSGSSTVSNEFTFGGNTFALSQGFIQEFGDNGNGSYDFDVILFDDGLSLDTTTGLVSGTGNAVVLDLNSDDMNGLSDGTYNFSTTREVFTIVSGGVVFGLDGSTGMSTSTEIATAGNVVLTVSDGIYDIEFNLTNADGEAMNGTYRGSITTL